MGSTRCSRSPLAVMLTVMFFSAFFVVNSVFASETKTINPIADVMIAEVSPDSNYNFNVMRVAWATKEGGFGKVSAYIKFDLSELPSGALIESATLSLYASDVTEMQTIEARYVSDDSWAETDITWNNAPTYTSTSTSSTDLMNANQLYSWTLTDDVKIAFEKSDKKLSVALITTTTTTEGQVLFHSKENTNLPKLDITFSAPAASNNMLLYLAVIVVVIAVGAVVIIYLRKKK